MQNMTKTQSATAQSPSDVLKSPLFSNQQSKIQRIFVKESLNVIVSLKNY